MPTNVPATGERKRRRRGQERIESLLDAAERVFAEVGFERATTNLIAARAAASPGTLYQFFTNKEQMAEAISARYAQQLSDLQREILDPLHHSSAAEAIDSVIDAYLGFLRSAPAYGALLVTAGVSQTVSERGSILVENAVQRLAGVIAKFVPSLSRADQRLHAEVCVMVFRGMIPMLQANSPRRRARAADEVKKVIKRYLTPLITPKARQKS